MGFKFKLEKDKSHILKKLVEALSGVVDETNFEVNPNGLIITAIDPGRNCLLKVQMAKETFDEFECTKEEKEIGINLGDLDKILKRLSAADSVEIGFEEERFRLYITMKRSEHRQKTFKLSLIDVAYEELPIDDLLKHDYEAGFTIDPELFDEAAKDAAIYSEVITVMAEKGKKVSFSSTGSIGEMCFEVGLADFKSVEIEKDCAATFGLTFLKNIFKIESIVENLVIAISSDHPMAMIIDLVGGGILYYLIAPRVEDYEEYE